MSLSSSLLALVFGLLLQTGPPVPAPNATVADQPAEPHELPLRRIEGHPVVGRAQLVDLLDRLFAVERTEWLAKRGLLIIQMSEHKVVLFANTPYLLIDQQAKRVERALIVTDAGVFVPLGTVQAMLERLGVEASVDRRTVRPTPEPTPADRAGGSTAPGTRDAVPPVGTPLQPSIALDLLEPSVPARGPEPAMPALDRTPTTSPETAVTPPPLETMPARPGTPTPHEPEPTPRPTPTAEPTDTAQPTPSPSPAPVPAVPSMPGRPARRLPKLNVPPQLAGRIGLTWAQLADMVHRQTPRRITLVCDELLQPVGQKVRQDLEQEGSLEVNLLVTSSPKRTHPTLLGHVQSTQPQLLVDLMVNPVDTREEAMAAAVWVVHEAVWPEDQGVPSDSPLPQHRYLVHEYQGMALGSLLRDHLARRFPERGVRFELAPLYLLRRIDAPSAGVLIAVSGSEQLGRLHARRVDNLAGAVGEAIHAYIQSMHAVTF